MNRSGEVKDMTLTCRYSHTKHSDQHIIAQRRGHAIVNSAVRSKFVLHTRKEVHVLILSSTVLDAPLRAQHRDFDRHVRITHDASAPLQARDELRLEMLHTKTHTHTHTHIYFPGVIPCVVESILVWFRLGKVSSQVVADLLCY